ncbi:MAG: hypothetical protein K1X51_14670 [Rhodospirillaceae bacterium]|nr:hypothetical protein [Rhodospirillaceae bacterium]
MNRSLASFAAALCMSAAAQAADSADAARVLNTTFPEAEETELALSGGPQHLRAGATVYVYGAKGFTKTHEGTNGFTCLLNRDAFLYGGIAFKPTCWDPEGATSYVPVMLRVGELLAAGESADAVKAEIAAGFRSGKYHRPARTGIAYMLAGDVLLEPGTGKVTKTQFPGHYMIYAPGVTNADVGYAPGKSGSGDPSIFSGGAGGAELGYLIAVPHRMP